MGRKKSSTNDQSKTTKQDELALKEIVDAYDSMKNAERVLKDARGTALQEAKEALKEVDDAINESKNCDSADLPHKTGVIVTCWEAYKATKAENAEAIKQASEDVTEAREALEKSIKDSRQGKLDFEIDGASDGAEA
jgi:cellobiose-specific phosphotransferase system component IIA